MSVTQTAYVFYGIKIKNLSPEQLNRCESEFNQMVVSLMTIGDVISDAPSEYFIAMRESIIELDGKSGAACSMSLNHLIPQHPEWDFIMQMVASHFSLETDGEAGYVFGVYVG